MDWVSFILGMAFGVLGSFTAVYLVIKTTALWIKKNGMPNMSKEKEEELWDDLGKL